MSQSRQLAAIMFTDIVGYTKLMGEDELKAFELLKKNRAVQRPIIEKFNGKWLKEIGDGVLASFPTVSDAVYCAATIQNICEEDPDLKLRIGIHQGEVVFEGADVFGDGVNIASRLESLAPIGGILVSDAVHKNVLNKKGIESTFIREEHLKNVREPVRIYQVQVESVKIPEPEPMSTAIDVSLHQIEHSEQKTFNQNKIIWGIAALILMALGYIFYASTSGNEIENISETEIIEKSIAVLPFISLSIDPEKQYLADGVMDAILLHLSKIEGLRVITRTSVEQYRNTTMTIPEIAAELNVHHVLEGSFQKHGNQANLIVQLSNAQQDEDHLWANEYNRNWSDIFAVQSEVSQTIARELQAVITPEEKQLIEKIPTTNLTAYDFYQKGQNLIRRTTGALKQLDEAERLFEQAIDLDPDFSLAYVGLANAYMQFADWGRLPPKEAILKAKTAALKAQSIDDELGECYETLGAISIYENDAQQAGIYLQKALEMSPGYVDTYTWLGKLSLLEGNLEESVTYFRKAEKLDPLSTIYIGNITLAYHIFGEYDRAIEVAEEVLLEHPTDSYMLWILANIYTEMQQYEQAIDIFKRRTAGTETNWALGYTYGKAGRIDEATKILEYQLERAIHSYVPSFMISTIYLGLDDQEMAIHWMEKAFDEGIMPILMVNVLKGSTYAPLRANLRFQELISPAIK